MIRNIGCLRRRMRHRWGMVHRGVRASGAARRCSLCLSEASGMLPTIAACVVAISLFASALLGWGWLVVAIVCLGLLLVTVGAGHTGRTDDQFSAAVPVWVLAQRE